MDFENWFLVNSMIVTKDSPIFDQLGGLHHIYVNAKGLPVLKMNRRVKVIPGRTVAALTEYDWPGNIRELQNFIERSVILSTGAELQAPLDELFRSQPVSKIKISTLAQAEYQHTLNILKETAWVVGGPSGAAKKLGLKRTTLIGKMRKMRISRSTEAMPSAFATDFTRTQNNVSFV